MDLFSLTIIGGLFFGAAAIADAAFFGHRVRVQVSVPKTIVDTGFTELTAEQVFRAKIQRIEQVSVIIPTQDVDLHSGQNVFAAMAKPLNLDGVVLALQQSIGLDVVSIDGSILANPKTPGLDMVMVLSSPSRPAGRFKLTQDDGDATALVERSASLALNDIAPVRAALSEFEDGMHGDSQGFVSARNTATRALARPWDPTFALQRVLLRNQLALLALADSDIAGADQQYQEAEAIPDQPDWAKALVAINRTFLAVAAKHPAQANQYLDVVTTIANDRYAPMRIAIAARLLTLRGLVAWSDGDIREAEHLFRRAITELPIDPEPHLYLAQVLTASGNTAGAEQEQAAALSVRRFERPLYGLIQSAFLTDPVNGGIKRRP